MRGTELSLFSLYKLAAAPRCEAVCLCMCVANVAAWNLHPKIASSQFQSVGDWESNRTYTIVNRDL